MTKLEPKSYIEVGGEAVMTALALWLVQQSIAFAAEFFQENAEWVITVPERYAQMVERRLAALR